jgi:hypothetical protein
MDLKEIRCEVDSTGSEQDPVAGSFEHGKYPWSSFESKEFLNRLSTSQGNCSQTARVCYMLYRELGKLC